MIALVRAVIKQRLQSKNARTKDQAGPDEYPFVATYVSGGRGESVSAQDEHSMRSFYIHTTAVAVDEDQADELRERVYQALTNWRPAITGAKTWKVTHLSDQVTRPDDDLDSTGLWIATDQWSLSLVPA